MPFRRRVGEADEVPEEDRDGTLPEQLKLEGLMMRELGYTADYKEGVAAFMGKRPPNFKGE